MTDVIEWTDEKLRGLKTERDELLARGTTLVNQLERVGELLDEIEAAAERDDPAAVRHWAEEAKRPLER